MSHFVHLMVSTPYSHLSCIDYLNFKVKKFHLSKSAIRKVQQKWNLDWTVETCVLVSRKAKYSWLKIRAQRVPFLWNSSGQVKFPFLHWWWENLIKILPRVTIKLTCTVECDAKFSHFLVAAVHHRRFASRGAHKHVACVAPATQANKLNIWKDTTYTCI